MFINNIFISLIANQLFQMFIILWHTVFCIFKKNNFSTFRFSTHWKKPALSFIASENSKSTRTKEQVSWSLSVTSITPKEMIISSYEPYSEAWVILQHYNLLTSMYIINPFPLFLNGVVHAHHSHILYWFYIFLKIDFCLLSIMFVVLFYIRHIRK